MSKGFLGSITNSNKTESLSIYTVYKHNIFKTYSKYGQGLMKLAMTIYGLPPMHSATPPKCSEGFDICNYGLTTTQQQAHNKTPAGFQISFKHKQ